MADREFFITDPDRTAKEYPNLEQADRAARALIEDGESEVFVIRCTATRLRRYQRQVSVAVEDVTRPA
ncbi:hypothetical protein HCJ93_08305 [Streptomyces sp. SBST2-5]|jgi:hypothetical protein|uniref:Uncharacterized protein n=1 Tax=Streptomyces composti TaxID=2720025 RepID=A0ABX1A0Y0_9ACTN|nr:hypothetical protein [Streptomyces composti]NJP50073.1 hypothetical protein [Streptomyces composti]